MADPAPRRLTASIVSILLGLAVLAGLWLLPDLTPRDIAPEIGQETLHARIVEDLGPDPAGLPGFVVEVLSGPSVGERLDAVVQAVGPGLPGADDREPYRVGDEVVVIRFTGAAGGGTVISEPWRVPLLAAIAAAFAAVVLVVGGLRGARSLVALAFTLTVIVKLVVPLLLRGVDPVLLAVAGGSGVAVVSLLLTEGFSRVASAALLGTAGALALTAGLAAAFTSLATFSALQGSEEIAFLVPLVGERIDLAGLLLAATVFGALGVLDDVTITQAAAVEQLHRANPVAGRRRVIGRAMRIGRAHIAATVNTLMLAYLGAGLPLLLLFALSGQEPMTVLNGEVVAVEIIRALVGSIGIVAAVPLTTVLAALLVVPRRPPENARTDVPA
jgi:uncharacterized membrane protein